MVAAVRHRETWVLRACALLGAALLLLTIGCAKATTPPAGGTGAPAATESEALLASALQDQVAGRAEQATATYQKVLKADPSNKVALYNLGVMDHTAGRTANAEKNYRAALVSDPNFGPALFNLAILRTSAAGGAAEATTLYRHLISIEPNNAPAHLNLGFLLKQTGQDAAGDVELRQAISLDPSLSSRIAPGILGSTATPTRAPGATGATAATGSTAAPAVTPAR